MTAGHLTGSFLLVSLQYLMTEDMGSTPTSVDSRVTVLLSFQDRDPIIADDMVTCTTRDLFLHLLDGQERRLSNSVVPCCVHAVLVLEVPH